jgi:signal transduction histidine kinase
MTLGRKLFLKTAGLILSLVVLAGVAIWGLWAQHTDLTRALEVRAHVREVYRLGRSATFARALLLDHGLDPAAIEQMRGTLGLFLDLRASDATLGSTEQRRADGNAVVRQMRAALADADRPGPPPSPEPVAAATEPAPASQPFNPSAFPGTGQGASPSRHGLAAAKQVAALDSLVSHLAGLAQDADKRIQDIQHDADSRQKRAIFVVTALALLIVAGAMALSFSLYRGVMGPLRRLHVGVRSIARGRFSQRLDARGDREFVELARDFNQMAEELEALYGELEQEVAAKNKDLMRSERLASVGFLAAGVAHEINNPLGIITGYAEMAQRRLRRTDPTPFSRGSQSRAPGAPSPDSTDPADPEVVQALQVICDEAFRCKRIIEKLLALAKPAAPGNAGAAPGTAGRELAALDAVADDVALLVRGLDRFRDRRLELDLERGGKTTVAAPAIEMKQVLLNLTLNALEAVAGDGTVRIEVRRVEDRPHAWVEVAVTDNGRGMSPWTLEHVFEPFFTDKHGKSGVEAAPAESSGAGLGLSIVHAIVVSRGGRVHAHSDGAGRGSRFTVRLPAEDAQA